MSDTDFSRLSRKIEEMPRFVEAALRVGGLMEIYHRRPAYQQNDYLSWIRRAKRPETKQKRLEQMLNELARGDRYMNMVWRPKG